MIIKELSGEKKELGERLCFREAKVDLKELQKNGKGGRKKSRNGAKTQDLLVENNLKKTVNGGKRGFKFLGEVRTKAKRSTSTRGVVEGGKKPS